MRQYTREIHGFLNISPRGLYFDSLKPKARTLFKKMDPQDGRFNVVQLLKSVLPEVASSRRLCGQCLTDVLAQLTTEKRGILAHALDIVTQERASNVSNQQPRVIILEGLDGIFGGVVNFVTAWPHITARLNSRHREKHTRCCSRKDFARTSIVPPNAAGLIAPFARNL